MKITAREKILLWVLCITALFALSYFFLIKPQLARIEALAMQQATLRVEVEKVNAELAPGNKLDADLKAIDAKIEDKTKRFYPEILQDRIVVILNDLINKSQLKQDTIGFNRLTIASVRINAPAEIKDYPVRDIAEQYKNPAAGQSDSAAPAQSTNAGTAQQQEAGDVNKVESLSATLKFEGTYEQMMNLIKMIEALDRTVVVNNLLADVNEQDLLTGSIQIDFYALPKVHDQDKQYFEWPFNNPYGRMNPFVQ